MPAPETGSLPTEEIAALDPLLARIGLAIFYGNLELAHALVEEGDILLRGDVEHDAGDPASAPLVAMGLGERTTNLLEKSLGITTVGELLATHPEELVVLPNFGLKTLENVLAAGRVWRAKIAAAGS